jgi:invasion protein IalB
MKHSFTIRHLATYLCFAILTILTFSSGTAYAEDDTDLGHYKKWQAHSYKEGKGQVCNMWSEPTKAEGKYKKRGRIFSFITHRPKDKRIGEVSFEMGYTLKSGRDITLTVGKSKFKLFGDGTTAFTYPQDDAKITKAMRKGATMIVSGLSSRGTKTKDTYSLSGFSKAHNAINKACKVK